MTAFARNQWYVVAYGREVGRELLARTVLGEPLVLYRTEAGEPVALADRCVHRRFPLSESRLDGDTIVCGYHGFTYDTAGTCVYVPGQKRIPRTARVRSYPVVEQDSFMWVWIGDRDPGPSDAVPRAPWLADSHVDLLLGNGLTRQYSLCGDPAEGSSWQTAVLREPDGRGGSAYVHDKLTEGAAVRVRGPRNNFALRPAGRYVFVAGGIGITPLLPMVAAAKASRARWQLLYGGRSRRSMAFLDRLAALGEGERNAVLVRPEDETGLLDLDTFLADSAEDGLVYCCGPEPLLAAVEERCRRRPPGTLQTERFRPREEEARSPEESFEVVLARSGLTLEVPPGRSVLETAEAAGVSVLSSCREGTCGTCETDVLAGVPDHRDCLLSEEERAAGQSMMICVSRSRGRLVLDL